MKSVSKNLNRKLEDWDIALAEINPITPEDMMTQRSMERLDIIQNVGSSKTRTEEQEQAAKEAIERFHNSKKGESILVYTDGSVHNRDRDQLP